MSRFASQGLRRVSRGPVIAILMYALMLVLPGIFSGQVSDTNYLDIFQSFANLAPLAVAVGLTMILAEFDISTVSTFSLGGVVVIKLSDSMGILPAIVIVAVIGIVLGLIQGGIVARLGISSVPVTLAGFLVIWGIAEIIAGGEGTPVIGTQYAAGEKLVEPVLSIFTFGSLLVIVGVVIVHLVMAYTRLGRNLRAVGGDRRASAISGIRVPLVIVGTFAAAGMIAALGGSLEALSYSSANPEVSFSPLLLAVIAAIIGGVGITGAEGSPFGIGCGVLALGILEETFIILGIDPDLATVLTGAFLLAIAVLSAPSLRLPGRRFLSSLPPALGGRARRSALDPSGS
jgi:ribose/xylose/arabinose/galactoside ABC-type transport system permease subunit